MLGAMRRGSYWMYEYIACGAGRRGWIWQTTLPTEAKALRVPVDAADGNW